MHGSVVKHIVYDQIMKFNIFSWQQIYNCNIMSFHVYIIFFRKYCWLYIMGARCILFSTLWKDITSMATITTLSSISLSVSPGIDYQWSFPDLPICVKNAMTPYLICCIIISVFTAMFTEQVTNIICNILVCCVWKITNISWMKLKRLRMIEVFISWKAQSYLL